MFKFVSTAALLIGGASLLAAQDASPPSPLLKEGVRSAVQVTAMDLDVVAIKGGEPVNDLRKEEFRIKVDGKELDLDYFTRVDAGTLHGPDLSTASPDLILETLTNDTGDRFIARQFVVFFDDAHLLPFEKKRAIEGLRDLITRLSPSDRLALLSVGDSARVVVPFTNSKEDLFDGLSRLEKMPPSGLRWDSDFRRTVLEIQRTRRASRESMIRSWAEQSRTREEATLRELRTSVSALAARSGKRALLFISGGLELFPGQSLYQALGTTSLVNQYELSVKDRFSDVIAEANRAGVTIHSIDARGLTTDVDATESQPSPFNSFLRNQNLRESLAGFAAETGGLLVAERNDFPKAFGEIYRQSSSYYLVGVTLSNLDSKKKTHSVSVTTTRPGVTLKTRRSFAAKAASEAARDRMSMALITPDAQGDFPIELAIGAPKKGGGLGRRLSPFELKIPLSQLTFSEENGQKKAAVEISIAAVEDNGAKSDFAPVPQTITVPVDRFEKARKESFLYTGEIKSRKGNMRFVATVRDVATDRVALVSNAVRVD